MLNAGSEIYLQSSGSLCADIGAIQPSTANSESGEVLDVSEIAGAPLSH